MQLPIDEYHAIIFDGWQFPGEVLAQQSFRKRLFVDELGWKLEHLNDSEFDDFDTPTTVFCSLYLGNTIVGCWRAIRTTSDYLGQKIFPQLATLRPYPRHPDIWEISRLGVIHHPNRTLSGTLIYSLMFHFACTRNLIAVCGVISPIHDRNFSISGIKTRRFGAPQTIGHNIRGRPVTAFFAEIRMAEQRREALDKVLAPITQLELQDDALVHRRKIVSA
jgi:acyl homoserine lactone synthase